MLSHFSNGECSLDFSTLGGRHGERVEAHTVTPVPKHKRVGAGGGIDSDYIYTSWNADPSKFRCGQKSGVFDPLASRNPKKISGRAKRREKVLLAKGRADDHSIAEFTIMFYYTKTVNQRTEDIRGYLKRCINYLNDAYKSSGVPLRAKMHCYKQLKVDEKDLKEPTYIVHELLPSLKNGNMDRVRHSADMAVAITEKMFLEGDFYTDGIAFDLYMLHTGQTLAWVNMRSMIYRQVLAHELSHLFGACHNYEVGGMTDCFTNEHRHWIPQGRYNRGKQLVNPDRNMYTGQKTIMAYTDPEKGINIGLNRFSDPYQHVPSPDGVPVPLGSHKCCAWDFLDTYGSNVVALLKNTRWLAAEVGREHQRCRKKL